MSMPPLGAYTDLSNPANRPGAKHRQERPDATGPAQINVDHCQSCGTPVTDPDAGYTDCCDEPVIPGSDDCTERCYHYEF